MLRVPNMRIERFQLFANVFLLFTTVQLQCSVFVVHCCLLLHGIGYQNCLLTFYWWRQ